MRYVLAAALLLTGSAMAASITEQERSALVSQFEETAGKFKAAVAGLSEAQWNYKAAPERWSILECAEHIALSEESLRQLVGMTLKRPAAEEGRAERPKRDAQILKSLVDRSQKAQSPERLQPKRRFATLAVAEAAFNEQRQRNIEYEKTTQEDLRGHATQHPVFKEMDAYQWLLLISAHSERHTLQILEVKADPGFPKK
jgi:hypothetical protein